MSDSERVILTCGGGTIVLAVRNASFDPAQRYAVMKFISDANPPTCGSVGLDHRELDLLLEAVQQATVEMRQPT